MSLIICDCTDNVELFLERKNELPNKVYKLIKNLKAKYNIQVEQIQCDNAGENVTQEVQNKSDGNGVTFEYTTFKQ